MAEHLISVGENMALAKARLRMLRTADDAATVRYQLLEARRFLNKASKELSTVAYWIENPSRLPQLKIVASGEE